MYKGFLFFLLLFGNIFYGEDSVEKKDVGDNKEKIPNIKDIVGNKNQLDLSELLKKNILSNKSDISFDTFIKYSADKKTQSEVDSNVFILEGNAKVEVANTTLNAETIKLTAKKDYNIVEGFGNPTKNKYFDPRVLVVFDNKKIYADEVKYCVDSARGIASNALYMQDKLIMRAQFLKKDFDDTIYAKNTFLTTCNVLKPHFGFTAKKAILKGHKFFLHGANLMLLGVRVPIPFSFMYLIPQERKSGFTYPSGANWSDSGFYMKDFGYYWYINDCRDLHITGTLYLGSLQFGFSARHNYIVRNSYSGSINYTYNASPIYKKMYGGSNFFRNNWAFTWQHKTLHTKLWSFSIDINLRGSGRDDNHSEEKDERTTNSSISFSRQKFLKIFSLNCNVNYEKNFKTKVENVTLPNISLSTETFNFFKVCSTSFSLDFLMKSTNKKISHNVREENDIEREEEIQVEENISFSMNNWKNIIKNIFPGLKFEIPLNINFKLFKGIKIGINAHYTGKVYNSIYNTNNKEIKKSWKKYYYIHSFSVGGSIGTTFKSKSLKFDEFSKTNIFHVKELLHSFSPSINFSFNPEANKINFIKCYIDNKNERVDLFAHTVFGNVNGYKSARVDFSANGSWNIKINDEGNIRTINLFTYNASIGYDFLDHNKNYWKNINLGLSTKIWKISISTNASFDLYKYTQNPKDTNKNKRTHDFWWAHRANDPRWYQEIWDEQRLESSVSISIPLLTPQKSKKEDKIIDIKKNVSETILPDYAKMVLWEELSMSLSYHYDYSYNPVQKKRDITHNCSINYSSKLSKSWDFNGNLVFNIEKMQVGSLGFNAKCDLHCWSLSMDFTIGRNNENHWNFSYNISLTPRDSILSTLGQNRSDNYDF